MAYRVRIDFKKVFNMVWHELCIRKYIITVNIRNQRAVLSTAEKKIGSEFKRSLCSLILFIIFLEKTKREALNDHEDSFNVKERLGSVLQMTRL